MNIAVAAMALRSGGALTIYNQFLFHLKEHVSDNKYYVFVSADMPKPNIRNVFYIDSSKHSGMQRIFFDAIGCKQYFKQHHIKIDVIVSLQNTSINMGKECHSVIYYHQSLPLYQYKWSFLKKDERLLFFYKNIYPFFVRLFLRKNTSVIVQTNFIKQAFIKKFRFSDENVHVLFPDVEKICPNDVETVDLGQTFFHFIYPASGASYKNHAILCRALGVIKKINYSIYKKIRIHFTISESNCPEFVRKEISNNEVVECIAFDGTMPHDKLLQFYKSSQCLLFPSYLETLGLPLLEAAAFGLPVLTVDLPYAHEVLEKYDGAFYIQFDDKDKWAEYMIMIISNYRRFRPLASTSSSSWNQFFELLK